MSKLRLASAALAATLAIATPFVAGYEGRSLVAYVDPVGIPTICYGHTADVKLGQTKTAAECDALLAGELGRAIEAVNRLTSVDLPDTRRAALASFVYNAGEGAFARSTMLRKLNAGDTRGACDELRRWVMSGGKKLGGLVRRREAERDLCLSGL